MRSRAGASASHMLSQILPSHMVHLMRSVVSGTRYTEEPLAEATKQVTGRAHPVAGATSRLEIMTHRNASGHLIKAKGEKLWRVLSGRPAGLRVHPQGWSPGGVAGAAPDLLQRQIDAA